MFKFSQIAIILFVLSFSSPVAGQDVDEYTLKAIWLEKFTHFIDWPPNAKDKKESFTIATYNTNPFNNKLEELYDGYCIWDKPVQISHLHELNDSTLIDILYIPPLKKAVVNQIIQKTKNKGIILIGDTKGYAEMGVHINFFLDEKTVRFEINESALRNSNFFVSYRLLNIAKIVEPIENN